VWNVVNLVHLKDVGIVIQVTSMVLSIGRRSIYEWNNNLNNWFWFVLVFVSDVSVIEMG